MCSCSKHPALRTPPGWLYETLPFVVLSLLLPGLGKLFQLGLQVIWPGCWIEKN